VEVQRYRHPRLERAQLLCIVLPQQYRTSTSDNDPIKATYLLCLGLVVLSLGGLTLTARWRIHGLGGVIGAAGVSTVGAFDMVNTLDRIGSSELGLGFWAGFLAPHPSRGIGQQIGF
jgi:hypothetical protein